MKGFKTFWKVIKRVHFEKIVMGFVVMFFITALVVTVTEPGIATYRDGLWYTFVACTTIGFGDITVTAFWGRLFTVIITIYEIVIAALMSGVVVSYYLEILHRREQETIVAFMDKLEHLTELSKEELREIEDRVRKLR